MKKLGLLFLTLLAFVGLNAQTPGELDDSFADNGILQFSISNSFDQAHCVLVQPDGKIITVGQTRQEGNVHAIFVARHLENGQVDATFGNNGIRTWSIQSGYSNYAMTSKLTDDGKIIVSGHIFVSNSNCHVFVTRLNEDGSDDTSFGNNGSLMINSSSADVVENLEIQNDGKMVLAGYRTPMGENDRMLVVRLLEDGQMDNSFGEGGAVSLNLPGFHSSYAFDVEIQQDGKIVLFGSGISANTTYFTPIIVRLNEDGSFDTTFGEAGVLSFAVGYGNDFLLSGCLHPDGRMFAGGHYWIANQPTLRYGFFVAGINPDGTFDTSFGDEGGIVKTEYDKEAANYLYDMKLSVDERLFCLGHATDGGYSDLVVLNFTMDGEMNSEFDQDGFVSIDIDGGVEISHCAAIQPDGKLLVGGWVSPAGVNYQSSPVIVRLHSGVLTALNETASKCVDFAYPNPTTGLLKFNLANDESVYQAKVYDMTGRVVMSQQIATQGTLDVSTLRSGSYFIQLVSDKETLVNRFVKE